MPVLHVCHEVSGWPNKRAWEQIVDIWPILLEFGPINDLLLFVVGRRLCRSLRKVTKRVKIKKSKLSFFIPKTISVIPYPYNFLVSYSIRERFEIHLMIKINGKKLRRFEVCVFCTYWVRLRVKPKLNTQSDSIRAKVFI